MTMANFYLVCFLVGLLLSLVTLVFGHMNLHLHVHLPHGGGHLQVGSAGHGGGVHGGGHAGGGHAAHGAHSGQADADLSPINFATVTAFLAWFGGTGYILTRYSTLWFLVALGLACLLGLAGAAVVFWFFSKLMRTEHVMDPADYDMVGVLGRVTSGIREGGTGEIVYVQGGTRHAVGARSEDGPGIAKEEEVVVTRYEKGIAYVRRWKDLAQEEESQVTSHE
jgi:membrane protein implicated in regulation of membrane protease activity